MRKLTLSPAVWLFSGVAALAVPSALHAEVVEGDAAAADAPGVATAPTSGDEILVTARRRAERMQDVPLAVSALGAVAIEQQAITEVNALRGKVPSLVVGVSPGGGRNSPIFTIRGQSQSELSGVADPSVSLYVNDIPLPRPHGANLSFFDIASVEVAKGPQGTLFGRNTTGGAILVRTKMPVDSFEAYLSQAVGNYGLFTTEAMINLPLDEKAALRIAGIHNQRKGYIHDVYLGDVNHTNQDGIRASLLLRPNDAITSTFVGSYTDIDDGGTGGFTTYAGNALFTRGVAEQQTRDIYHIASGLPTFARIKTHSIDNVTSIELSDRFTLKNTLGYRHLDMHLLEDLDGNSDQIFSLERQVKQWQVTEELQVQANFDNFNFILGAFFFHEKMDDKALSTGSLIGTGAVDPGLIEPDSVLAFSPRISNTWIKPVNTSYAAFFQGSYTFLPGLSATAGIRLNHDVREVTTLNRGFQPAISTAGITCRFTLDEDNDPATPETRPTLDNCVFRGRAKFTEPTYNLSLDYKPRDGMLFYVAHRHGYRTGGFSARGNRQTTLAQTFQPEIVDDFEVGFKADWRIDGMFLRTNVAAYTAAYKDLQRILTLGLSPPVTQTTNAAQARIRGIEAEVTFRPIPAIELSANYTLTDAKFRKYIGLNGEDLSPQIFPRAPRNMYGATLQVTLPIASDKGELTAAISLHHQDSYDNNDDYALEVSSAGVPIPAGVIANRAQVIEGYTVWNANVQWRRVFGSDISLSAFVDNLFDKAYQLPFSSTSGVYESRVAAAPRLWGIRARVDFR